MSDDPAAGRRSTDADFGAVVEWRKGVDEKLNAIHDQTRDTNGRVSELEVKERIRQDREEQKAIRDAAAEAAKYRIEQKERDDAEAAEELHHVRITWRVMLGAAGVGALPGVVLESARLIATGHL